MHSKSTTITGLLLPKKRECFNCDSKACIVRKYCTANWRVFLSKYKSTLLVPPGEKIFSKGDKVEGIYCVYSGYLKVYEVDNRSEKIVDLIKGGEILGYRGLGNKASKYTVSAQALSECEITFFPMEVFRLAIEANKDLAFFIIDLLTTKLKNIELRSNNYTNIQAKEKIRYAIGDMITSFGIQNNDDNKLKFTLSRKDIASLAGTTYETVIRVLGELDKQNHIALIGKSISILNSEHFEV